MKHIFSIVVSIGICLSASGQFANTNTGAISPTLPSTITSAGRVINGPSAAMANAAGWLTITNTQSPAAGWAVDSYTINATPPNCSLTIATQHNIQVAQDAVWTNSPNWLAIAGEAHTYSNLVWKYSPGHYTASISNFVTTPQTIMQYYATNACTWATSSNSIEFMQATWYLSDIISFAGVSTNFPWRLCP